MTTEHLRLEPPDRGVLFVVSGPSGVGKSTLLHDAFDHIQGLAFSVSATTRDPRQGEVDGTDYLFVTEQRFSELVAEHAFLEHATVYEHRYGTLRETVEISLCAHDSLILDIDVQGAEQVRHALPEAVHVMILPPSFDTLEARLRARATDSEETILRRTAQAATQLRGAPSYDYVVINDDLASASAAFRGILLAEMCRVGRRRKAIERAMPPGLS